MAATRVLTLVSLVMSTTTTKSVDTYLSIPTWRRYQELTIAEFGPHTAMILQLQTTEFNHKSRSCLGGYGSLPLDGIFVWDFPTLCQHRRYYIIYCHVVSMRKREDLGISVCVWRPSVFSVVVIWRISTCFLGAINLHGKESRMNEEKLSEVL